MKQARDKSVGRPHAQYLRPDRQGLLSMRQAHTREDRWVVYGAAERASNLALSFIRNNGWLAGAVDQIIADTVGEELKLNSRADLTSLGYDAKEEADWRQLVEKEWRQWAWTPSECDLAAKATFAEILDGVMRHYLVHGEAFGRLDYLPARSRRGSMTGTRVSLIPPSRIPRETDLFSGLDGGVYHDSFGRASAYRVKVEAQGVEDERSIPARNIVHVMDRGENPGVARGISVLSPILKVAAQYDQLADATLAVALMQQAFAAVIKSPEASESAFEALQALDAGDVPNGYDAEEWGEVVDDLKAGFVVGWADRLAAVREGSLSLNDPAGIGHLAPGEELEMVTASAPNSQYIPFSQNLQREMARRLGVTFESFSMDHSNATYSSVRMGISAIWPIVLRRRLRVVGAFADRVYDRWLEEKILTGQIPLKGGVPAFLANRSRVVFCEWQGPARPSADDYKSAMAAKTRLEIGLSSLADECAEYGRDWEENATQISREMAVLSERGIPHPFGRAKGGDGGQEAEKDEVSKDARKQ